MKVARRMTRQWKPEPLAAPSPRKKAKPLTQDWMIRHCDSCGVLESDLRAVLVVDNHGDVVHLRDGLFVCGVMAEVVDEVTP
jgi:hypothetical protein